MSKVEVNRFVVDIEMNKVGYVVDYDNELESFLVNFKDDPENIYWISEDQLKVVDHDIENDVIL